MREDISCVFEGVAGIGAIYISNLKAAQNINLLNSLKIKAIVTAVRGGIIQHPKHDIQDYLYVAADDIETYDLSKHFQKTYQFIDNTRKKTNILVHCYAGISRSATIVIAYLMRKYNYSLQKVITMVKRKRNKVNPNHGFINQLKKQANKFGIAVQQNKAGVEGVLRKYSYSVDKKRNYTSGKIKKLINQMESIKNTNILLEQLHKKSQIYQANPQIQQPQLNNLQNRSSLIKYNQTKNVDIGIDEINFTSQIIKIGQQKQNQVHINLHNPKNPQKQQQLTSIPPQQPSVFKNKSNHLLTHKLQKIQKLKTKVFQLQNRKRLAKGHSSHKSQLKADSKWMQNYKKTSIFLPYGSQSLIVQQKNAIQHKLFLFSNQFLSPEKLYKNG